MDRRHRTLCLVAGICVLVLEAARPVFSNDSDLAKRREQFGQQVFGPDGGFVIKQGGTLTPLVWNDPDTIAALTELASIRTRWFNENLEAVTVADHPGRYFAYGEATGPGGSIFREAWTCVCIAADTDLSAFAERRIPKVNDETAEARRAQIESMIESWRHTGEGAVELAAILESGEIPEPRAGQWQMEDATRHVRLKRRLLGLDDKAPAVVSARRIEGEPAPVLRRGSADQTGITARQIAMLEARLDAWYAEAKKPAAIVIAKDGVIVVEKNYGELNGEPVTVDTPMLLHSAMKPLIGIQLAMYVDRGLVDLDQPIGDFLPAFNTPEDRLLTFRAGHAHLSGIHFPWPLAFSRLFYFHTWHESLIAHQPREWAAGTNYRYGVVGVILAVRSLELISGRNYWDAMEREVFEPLGIRNILPGGTGFSAENLARFGVMLANHGKYGEWELFSEDTYRKIVPASLTPHFPEVQRIYGVGLQEYKHHLGTGSYGHGGGCGTLFAVHPDGNLVFAMVRNEQGEGYKTHREGVMKLLRGWVEKAPPP